MPLSDRYSSKHQSRSGEERERSEEGFLNTAIAYPQPLLGVLNGRPVSILATGDIKGMSPAFQYVDEEGRVDWESTDKFLIIDARALPMSAQTLERLQDITKGLRGSRERV